MALDQEYFDSIEIEVVRKKYYNANKVEAVFADIRRQAEELNRENEALRRELDKQRSRKTELSQAAISARDIYRRMIDKARAESEEMLAQAREESEAIRAAALQQQEDCARQVGACLGRVRRAQEEAIEGLSREWQRFLCGLYPEDRPEQQIPADLSDKVDAIARELSQIGGADMDEDGETE